MGLNVLCIIQARYGSKRLPGKMLMKVGGETLISRAYRLACESFGKENVIVAGTMTDGDSPLREELRRIEASAYWANIDEADVLGRFYKTATLHPKTYAGRTFHRWTPDDFRKDPEMCRRVASGEKGIPVEIGGEAFTFRQLKEWHETVTDPFLREHIGILVNPNPVSPPDDGLPWSIDSQDDLDRANAFLSVTA